jgi:hypothetical protein
LTRLHHHLQFLALTGKLLLKGWIHSLHKVVHLGGILLLLGVLLLTRHLRGHLLAGLLGRCLTHCNFKIRLCLK